MQKYINNHGTSYRLANYFFPQDIKEEVIGLYAFVRIPDDIVDSNKTPNKEKREQLDVLVSQANHILQGNRKHKEWKEKKWREREETENERNNICFFVREIVNKYEIPQEWITAFFDAMYKDLEVNRYTTYQELQGYMYGSAEVVWLMMSNIIGYNQWDKKEVIRTASLLGEAMQYTNFLRDVYEDYIEYNRIYMPIDRLEKYWLDHQDIINLCNGQKESFANRTLFIKAQIALTRKLYAEANTGIKHLNSEGQKAVWYASQLYEAILDKIESKSYDVFTTDMHTTRWEKAKALYTARRKQPF